MSEKEKKPNLHQKLLAVKKQVPSISKDAKGFNYTYASPSAVLGVLNPLLNEQGILLKTEVLNVRTERVFVKKKACDIWIDDVKTHEMIDVYETLFHLDMKFTWMDTDIDDDLECLFSASGLNGYDKGLGSALTYAERYFLLKFFNIPTDDDDPDALTNKQEAEPTQSSSGKEEKEWLTEAQFKKAMKANAKGVTATLNKFSKPGFGMKKVYRAKLNSRIAELKTN